MGFLDKIFGSYSDRELKKIVPIAKSVMALEEEYSSLSDEQLRGKTAAFKNRLSAGETLDDLLPEAFATAREAACSRHEAFLCTGNRRYRASSGPHRRNENRRGQNTCCRSSFLS